MPDALPTVGPLVCLAALAVLVIGAVFVVGFAMPRRNKGDAGPVRELARQVADLERDMRRLESEVAELRRGPRPDRTTTDIRE